MSRYSISTSAIFGVLWAVAGSACLPSFTTRLEYAGRATGCAPSSSGGDASAAPEPGDGGPGPGDRYTEVADHALELVIDYGTGCCSTGGAATARVTSHEPECWRGTSGEESFIAVQGDELDIAVAAECVAPSLPAGLELRLRRDGEGWDYTGTATYLLKSSPRATCEVKLDLTPP